VTEEADALPQGPWGSGGGLIGRSDEARDAAQRYIDAGHVLGDWTQHHNARLAFLAGDQHGYAAGAADREQAKATVAAEERAMVHAALELAIDHLNTLPAPSSTLYKRDQEVRRRLRAALAATADAAPATDDEGKSVADHG
jgi:hypothetical protein